MSGTECLVPFVDNGGQRSFVERRRKTNIRYLRDRRSNRDRRNIIDRRLIDNRKRHHGPERRDIFHK
jgi:hypothetical protein